MSCGPPQPTFFISGSGSTVPALSAFSVSCHVAYTRAFSILADVGEEPGCAHCIAFVATCHQPSKRGHPNCMRWSMDTYFPSTCPKFVAPLGPPPTLFVSELSSQPEYSPRCYLCHRALPYLVEVCEPYKCLFSFRCPSHKQLSTTLIFTFSFTTPIGAILNSSAYFT